MMAVAERPASTPGIPTLGRREVPRAVAGRLKVVKVNVDNNPSTAGRFEAQSIPTLVLLQNGAVVDRFVGAQPERVLVQRIDALLPGPA